MESHADPALSELLARVQWVRGLAGALVRDADRADDLAQDAWVRALRGGPAKAAAWRGWFSRVMKNRLADEGRLQGKHARFTARQPRAGGPSEEEIRQQMETHEALSEAIRALPDPYRRAVFLHYFEGWSLARIAAEDGCDKRAIEKRLRQARAMMRTHLERRAPAEHWALGLLLLAPAPQKAVTLAVAAALLSIALIVPAAWLLRPDSAAIAPAVDPAAVPASSATAAATVQSGAESAPPAGGLAFDEIGREESNADGFDFILAMQDQLTKLPVSNVEVQVRTRDELQRTLESTEGVSDAHGEVRVHFQRLVSWALVSVKAPGRYTSVPRWEMGWGEPRSEVRMEVMLEPWQGSVAGRVVDDGGVPVPGAKVDLWMGRSELGPEGPDPDFTIAADEAGEFRVAPARADRSSLLLVPRAEGMAATQAFEINRDLPANAEVSGIELVLAAGHPLRVQVADELGRPIEGAQVSVWPARGSDPDDRRADGELRGRRSHYLVSGADGWTKTVMATLEPWQVNAQHSSFGRAETQRVSAEQSEALVILPIGRVVEGTLLAPDGLALPDGIIIVETAADSFEIRSAEDGSFQFAAPGSRGDEVRLQIQPTRGLAHHVIGPFVPEDVAQPLAVTLQPGANLVVALVLADGSPFPAMQMVEWDVLDGPRARAPGGDAGTEQSWFRLREGSPPEFGFKENCFRAFGSPLDTYSFRFWTPDGWSGQADLTPGVRDQQIVMRQP